MNLVGKILVVALFVMALVFAAFTLAVHATHKNWKMALDNPNPKKGEVKGKVQELADKEVEIARLTTERTELQQKALRTANEAEVRIAQVESALNEAKDQVKRKDTELNDKSTALKEAVDNASKAATLLQTTQDDNKKITAQNVALTTQRDEALESVLKLTDAVANKTGEVTRLEVTNRRLAMHAAKLSQVVRDRGLPESLETPTVEGLVTKTHTTEKMVQINLGSDDGLKRDDKLDVFRVGSSQASTRYLGQIVLTRVDKTESVGSVIKTEATIQERDYVATRIDK